MKQIICVVVHAICAFAGSMQAQTSLEFQTGDFGETIRNEFTFASGGVSATATAWSMSRTASFPVFAAAELVRWSPGMGVKNSSEYVSGTSSTPYYVDNQDHYDFVLFRFSEQVDISSVVVNPSMGTFDLDVSFWLGNLDSQASLAGTSFSGLGALGFGSRIDSDWTASSSSRAVDIVSPTSGINALLFGARVGGDSAFDRFKISLMRGTTVPPDLMHVPEPGSLTLLGVGLWFLVLRRRR